MDALRRIGGGAVKRLSARDLVWKAQPAMACLKSLLEQDGNLKFAEMVGEWLDQARELLRRRSDRKARGGGA